jgi:RHS repeat-associated protein
MDKHGHDKVSYAYAEDGLMATRSDGHETTAYSWDTLEQLPELAVETTSEKGSWRFDIKDSRSYTYGEGPIGIEAGKDSITFHTDSLGSVVQLSDDKGRLLQSYRYSPFGGDYSSTSALNAKADDLNPIRFTGQYLDSETDLYNMRAREYDPETARFLETDPVEAGAGDAYVSFYVYADDQPTVMTDPSGECPIAGDTPTCMKGWKNPKSRKHSSCVGSSCRSQRKVVHVVVIVAKHTPGAIDNAIKGANRAASRGGTLMHSSDPVMKSLGSSLLNQSKTTKLIRSTKVANGLWVASFAIDSYDIYQSTKKGSRAASVETTGTIFAWGGTVGGVIVCGLGTSLSGVGAAGCGAITIFGSIGGRYLGRKIGNTLYRPGYWLGGKSYDLYSWRP